MLFANSKGTEIFQFISLHFTNALRYEPKCSQTWRKFDISRVLQLTSVSITFQEPLVFPHNKE